MNELKFLPISHRIRRFGKKHDWEYGLLLRVFFVYFLSILESPCMEKKLILCNMEKDKHKCLGQHEGEQIMSECLV